MVEKKTRENKGAGRKEVSRGVLVFAGLAVLMGILALTQFRNAAGFHWSDFFSTFVSVDKLWLAGAITLLLLTYIVRSLRWMVMLRPVKSNSSLSNVTSSTLIGFTAVVLLGRAGEVVRPYLVSLKENVKFSSQMAVWFLERIFDLLAVLLIFGIALARMPSGLHVGTTIAWVLRTGGYFITSIGAVCVILLVAFRNFGAAAERRIVNALSAFPEGLRLRIERILKAFTQGMQCTRDRQSLSLLAGYTAIMWVMIVMGHFCIFRAVPATARFDLDKTMVFLGFVAFGSVVQLPGIGGGVQAASVLVLTEIFGITSGEAWGMAMLIWLLSWVLVVPLGLAFAHRDRLSWRRISHISEDEAEAESP